jgi:hypothetical protein
MFNSCHYQDRFMERRREADRLYDLGEYKNFPRERLVKTRQSWLSRFFLWIGSRSLLSTFKTLRG